jgi:serine/threonine protein kinase
MVDVINQNQNYVSNSNEHDKKLSKSTIKKLTTEKEKFNYQPLQLIGSGSFGTVYQAICVETKETVAVKKVYQDTKYKNRELQILKELDHPSVIKMRDYFFTPGEKKDEIYLNVVMDYFSDTLSQVIRGNLKANKQLPLIVVKIYAFQMLKAINYLNAIGICHRDIKPQNILIDPNSHVLKICDFGSAKKLSKGEPNVAYICSRFYRAPELIFGATEYDSAIDTWSIGCVIAELVLNEPIFPGESSIDQLFEIIKVLGTPSKKQIKEMNPNYEEYKFPIIKSYTWSNIFKNKSHIIEKDFIDLLSKLVRYEPNKRISPLQALLHPFFDELREKDIKLPNDVAVPNTLFTFTKEEYYHDSNGLIKKIVPEWIKSSIV